jgi:hypothetical protein
LCFFVSVFDETKKKANNLISIRALTFCLNHHAFLICVGFVFCLQFTTKHCCWSNQSLLTQNEMSYYVISYRIFLDLKTMTTVPDQHQNKSVILTFLVANDSFQMLLKSKRLTGDSRR